jgi:uncharacterized protein (TIRG00374 family)
MKHLPAHHGSDRSPTDAGSRRDDGHELFPPDWGLGRRRIWPWILGFLILSTLIFVVLQFSSIGQFVELARASHPKWVLLAGIAQILTYVCAATVWRQALRRAGHPRSLRSLFPLGVAKLYMDQAIPSGGASGTLLVVRGLTRRHVSLHLAMAAMLVGLVSYDAAYLIAVLGSAGILWLHNRADLAPVAAVAVFAAIVVTIPVAVLILKNRVDHVPTAWLQKVPGVAALLNALAKAPTDLLRDVGLLAQTVLLQLGIFLLDAATLWIAFRAVGLDVDFWIAIVSFVIASMTATIAPIPLGLGTFEAGSIGMLRLLGVPIEAAFAATILLRGFTFWLPMLPGLWLARREIGRI